MIMSLKQRKIKFEPGIKLNHNIYNRRSCGCACAVAITFRTREVNVYLFMAVAVMSTCSFRGCHAPFVLVVIDSCASDPRSSIRGQRMATTKSPPVDVYSEQIRMLIR